MSASHSLFQELEFQELLLDEKIRQANGEIKKVKKMCGWYGPSDISGIDYSRESSPTTRISFDAGLQRIQKLQDSIKRLRQQKKDIRKRKNTVEKVYKNLPDMESKVYYERVIMQNTQNVAAVKLNVSVRHLQRIEQQMKARGVM